MTTIISDAIYVAADARVTSGNILDSVDAVKIRKYKNRVIACAGDYSMARALFEWAKNGYGDDDCPWLEGAEWEMLDVSAGKILYMSNDAYEPTLTGIPAAIGSGSAYALSAYAGGAPLRKCIEIAARYDNCTGGKIRVLKVPTASPQ